MKRFVQLAVLAAAFTLTVGLAKAQDIKIAVVGSITGSTAVFGEQEKRGAEMAVKGINARGGVLGNRLDLIVADDACDPKQAVAAANNVVGKGVVLSPGTLARRRRFRRPSFTTRRGCY
jgi:branched-chain amino acid transport system substrate-binding protein